MKTEFQVGDLVRLHDSADKDRQMGIVVDISPRPAHIVSHGKSNLVRVFWPAINETDWEYDFFLKKIEEPDLTKNNQ